MIAVIEMPEGSSLKIEKHKLGFIVDRVLPIPVPSAYGYIPDTLAPDGDPDDVFVISSHALQTGLTVKIKPHTMIKATDNGVVDNKLVAILESDELSTSFIEATIGSILFYLKNYKKGFIIDQIEKIN